MRFTVVQHSFACEETIGNYKQYKSEKDGEICQELAFSNQRSSKLFPDDGGAFDRSCAVGFDWGAFLLYGSNLFCAAFAARNDALPCSLSEGDFSYE